ncbi:MAG: hypothetical protein E7212_06645 [Clostridium sartagoforme]|nr:hypothetical protein [Clostridium sartagoforme]
MRKAILLFYCIIQYFIIAVSFLAFTSTMEIIPWYEPLTMGAFLVLMVVTPIQLLLSLIVILLKEKLLINKSMIRVSNINSFILASIFIITVLNEELFYPLSVVLSVVEVLLALYLFIAIIKRKY